MKCPHCLNLDAGSERVNLRLEASPVPWEIPSSTEQTESLCLSLWKEKPKWSKWRKFRLSGLHTQAQRTAWPAAGRTPSLSSQGYVLSLSSLTWLKPHFKREDKRKKRGDEEPRWMSGRRAKWKNPATTRNTWILGAEGTPSQLWVPPTFLDSLRLSSTKRFSLGAKVLILALTWKKHGRYSIQRDSILFPGSWEDHREWDLLLHRSHLGTRKWRVLSCLTKVPGS